MPSQPQPLAALLDAHVQAHHAGVSDADIAILQDIGEDFAAFAERVAGKFARLGGGAAGTNRSNPDGPPVARFEFDEPAGLVDCLLSLLDEDAYGYSLDHTDVVRTAAALRLHGPAPIERAAA